MRRYMIWLIVALVVSVSHSPSIFAQTTRTPGAGTSQKAGPAPPRDLSGVWNLANRGGELGSTLSPDPPPMTAWGQAKFKANKPGYGPHALAVGNDPLLRCDPPSVPRILFFPRPFEIIQIPGRTLVSYETNSTWREIWTDGRELPKDPDRDMPDRVR